MSRGSAGRSTARDEEDALAAEAGEGGDRPGGQRLLHEVRDDDECLQREGDAVPAQRLRPLDARSPDRMEQERETRRENLLRRGNAQQQDRGGPHDHPATLAHPVVQARSVFVSRTRVVIALANT